MTTAPEHVSVDQRRTDNAADLVGKHLAGVRNYYDSPASELTRAGRSYRRQLAYYYNLQILALTLFRWKNPSA